MATTPTSASNDGAPTTLDGEASVTTLRQKTVRNAVRASGVGLHSGRQVNLRIAPAEADSGIRFRRVDLLDTGTPPDEHSGDILASPENVVATAMSTTLAEGAARVSTVEHLMAAFAGLGIDNALVEIDAPELPIMDGSAAPFLFLLKSAGTQDQPAPRRFARILRQVRYTEGDTSVQLEPYDGFRVGYTLMYDHPVFRAHTTTATVDFAGSPFEAVFEREISRARTFGFMQDLERLQQMNLAQGGSLDNAVVVGDDGILNAGGLRSEDEFVKHKILDALGDLYLFGCPILGAFTGHKSGHRANNRLLRMLLDSPDAYEIVSAVSRDELAQSA